MSDTTNARPLLVRDWDGNVYRWTIAEWFARDVNDGYQRVDEHGNELADDAPLDDSIQDVLFRDTSARLIGD